MYIVEDLESAGSTQGDLSDLSAQVYLMEIISADIFKLIILEFLPLGISMCTCAF